MVRIGAGAGFSGDRLEPAAILVEKGQLDYLVLESLAERTIALAQKQKWKNPSRGYDPLLEKRMELLLPLIVKHRVRLITNMGAANPVAAAERIAAMAREKGLKIKVAAVIGDDVMEKIDKQMLAIESGKPIDSYGTILSANAYLGADALLPALQSGADVIVTGRVADPSLFLAPMIYHYGWPLDDTERLAKGAIVGHLLECAGQITGGYFADPGKKDVPGMARLGFPFADVMPDGTAVISKVDGTGGIICPMTVKEQLLYEVTDPTAYITPDVVVDLTTVQLREIGPDRVEITGGSGKTKPDMLKVSIGYHGGFVGEGEISYAGPNALRRAQLAGEIVYERLKDCFVNLKVDYIGLSSAHRSFLGQGGEPYEVRLRVAGKADTKEQAELIGEEVESLYTNGPAGGGGARKYVHEVIGIISTLIPRQMVNVQITIRE
ncbi:acyclic terpene utilization AtuA family protein [Geobacillus thermodenitrificans]|jgi:hypothetical protein|uniref:acyclic terpene utilization AtuA family protein n=1 Tax=Geobacillus thermodenitrificans TaxID=33940 RepID=UPI000D3D832F|nr:acyclic terpene utilization AtuA family protein [Geobacillus thermodenitrificans]PTR48244.1 ABC transporter substrate-binding protein [Geobacillus thermodenitrificans]